MTIAAAAAFTVSTLLLLLAALMLVGETGSAETWEVESAEFDLEMAKVGGSNVQREEGRGREARGGAFSL